MGFVFVFVTGGLFFIQLYAGFNSVQVRKESFAKSDAKATTPSDFCNKHRRDAPPPRLSREAGHRVRACSRRAEMSALASARAERAALCDRPAPAGTLDLSLGVFGFARGSRVVSLKALGVPVACSHDLGASHHDRRHFIDKDFLLSLPNGAQLLEAARATKPSPPCRAVVCLADADVHEIGSDVSRLADRADARGLPLGADAPHPSSGASLRVLGMLPVPLPVTLRVRPGALAGSPRRDAGDAHASPRKITARLADVVVVEHLPVPAHVSLRRATECASSRARDDVVADLVLCVCDPRAPKTKPGAFPERYRARVGWEGVTVGVENDSDERSGRDCDCDDHRGGDVARAWFANHQKKATRAAAVYDAEDRFAAERHRLSRAPDDAVAVACARCGAREGKPPGRALRRCAGCFFEHENDAFSHYCSKACQARDWGRHRDVCHAGVAGRRRRREIGSGAEEHRGSVAENFARHEERAASAPRMCVEMKKDARVDRL